MTAQERRAAALEAAARVAQAYNSSTYKQLGNTEVFVKRLAREFANFINVGRFR